MTAPVAPGLPPATDPGLPRPPRPTPRPPTGQVLADRLAEGRWRLAGVTAVGVLACALCLQPLLDRGWWLPTTVVVVVVVVLTGAAVRILRAPAPLQPVAQGVALLVALTVRFARDEAVWGVVPGPAALARLQELAGQGREYAIETVPPAGSDVGLLLLIAGGIGLAALAADCLVCGLDLAGASLIPFAALYGVPWVVRNGEVGVAWFVVVALAWLAVLATDQRERTARWSPGARAATRLLAVAVGGTTVLVAASSGWLAGAGTGLAQRVGTGGNAVSVDAMVSLRRAIVSQDPRILVRYTTTATRPEYLRLAVLEDFDGEVWATRPVQNLVSRAPLDPEASSATDAYRLDVGPLAGTTLPAPARALGTAADWPTQWDVDSSLVFRVDGRSVRGTSATVFVSPDTRTADDLRATSALPVAGPDLERTAPDPEPLTGPELPELARAITADAQTPFDAALALQRWFTTEGGFRYSTEVESDSGSDALNEFLEERVGYCEQFAATMALMARAVGIPARVVVGFTQGRPVGPEWLVRGTDAHAWPELWLGGAGWVRFEPTPGSPSASAPRYTRPDSEVDPGSGATPTPGATAGDGRPDRELAPDLAGAGGATSSSPRRVVATIALAGLLLACLVPGGVRGLRRRRRLGSGTAEDAYREVVDALLDLHGDREQATPRTTMALVLLRSGNDPSARAACARLLGDVERGRYAGDAAAGQAGAAAGRAGAAAGQARAAHPASPGDDARAALAALRRTAGRGRRVRAGVAPASVLGWPPRVVPTSGWAAAPSPAAADAGAGTSLGGSAAPHHGRPPAGAAD